MICFGCCFIHLIFLLFIFNLFGLFYLIFFDKIIISYSPRLYKFIVLSVSFLALFLFFILFIAIFIQIFWFFMDYIVKMNGLPDGAAGSNIGSGSGPGPGPGGNPNPGSNPAPGHPVGRSTDEDQAF